MIESIGKPRLGRRDRKAITAALESECQQIVFDGSYRLAHCTLEWLSHWAVDVDKNRLKARFANGSVILVRVADSEK